MGSGLSGTLFQNGQKRTSSVMIVAQHGTARARPRTMPRAAFDGGSTDRDRGSARSRSAAGGAAGSA